MDLSGRILFMEDLTEYLYHLDRLMLQFKRSGQLDGLNGVVVGQFTEMLDNDVGFGQTAYEIISHALSSLTIPVAFNAPIGHISDNIAVYHGRPVHLNVGATSQIVF
jgi:muramoyltetrapeptide carboxypeptidase